MGRKTEKRMADMLAGIFAKDTRTVTQLGKGGLNACKAVGHARKKLAMCGIPQDVMYTHTPLVTELDYDNEFDLACEVSKAMAAAAASDSSCVVVPLGCCCDEIQGDETRGGHASCLFVDMVNHTILHYDPYGYNSLLIVSMTQFVNDLCESLWSESEIYLRPVYRTESTPGIQGHHPLCMWYTTFAAFTILSWFHESTASTDDLVSFVDRFNAMGRDVTLQTSFALWCMEYLDA